MALTINFSSWRVRFRWVYTPAAAVVKPELELSFFRRLFEPVFGDAELLLVLFVQLDALPQPVDEFVVRQFPQPLDSAARNERPASGDELIGDLYEQRRQTFRRVVVGRYAVDDAHWADQSRQNIHQHLLHSQTTQLNFSAFTRVKVSTNETSGKTALLAKTQCDIIAVQVNFEKY